MQVSGSEVYYHTQVTSQKDQKQYWADTSKPYCYVSIHEFANAFNTFHVGIKLKEELGVKFPRHKVTPLLLHTLITLFL